MEGAQEFKLCLFFLLFFLVNSVLTQHDAPPSGFERSALLDLRSSLGIRARFWPIKLNPCANWTGVSCSNGRVVGINLSGLRRTRVGRRNPRFAVDALVNLTALGSFNSSGFRLPGLIPDWLSSSLSALQVLDLRSSSIIGAIPQSIGNMNNLNSLILSGNSLTGVIPTSLGQLSSLSVLDVSNNLLSGSIPSAFSALRNLTYLDLSSNFMSGSIPLGFGSLSSLQFLNLSNNSLVGSVPTQIGNLSQLVELDLGFNSLSGLLPEELGGLRTLRRLLIESNELGGLFPGNLFRNLPHLHQVDVSDNNFSGNFQDLVAFFNATGVMMLNFSNNQFYGSLISAVGNFGLIDLSSNYIRGLAPNTSGNSVAITRNCFIGVPAQRSLEDCRAFYAQRGLPFDDDPLSPTQPPFTRARKSRNRLIYVLAGVFGGIGFILLLILVLVLVFKICKQRNVRQIGTANVRPIQEEVNSTAQKPFVLTVVGDSFSYEQILQATSGFSDTNLIKHGHSGDLFLGRLEGGLAVVIKRVDLRLLKKESYMLELDLLSKASHTRLVPFLGHCFENENEKLLVYKYMPNGDLSNSLFRVGNVEDDGLQSLDWITRLKIAIGAAEGLSYLHHECNPPLVHSDVQASSILLDDKYDVRLGSLNEVRAQAVDSQQNVISRLLRISQTSEHGPSGSSTLTCSYDVYCFGKVLLELVTGKLGISKSDDASTKEWLDQTLPFISIYDKEQVAKIVDQSLVIDDDLLEEVWAVAIVAKSCLNPKPSKRPLMRHILRALENPFKVVREENFSSARLRTASSRRSWSAAVFGSWRHSSSESANLQSQNRDGISGVKLSERINSQGSTNDRRLSNEIFPEPTEIEDAERHDENER